MINTLQQLKNYILSCKQTKYAEI